GWQDILDRRPELHGAKQSARNEQRRFGPFLSQCERESRRRDRQSYPGSLFRSDGYGWRLECGGSCPGEGVATASDPRRDQAQLAAGKDGPAASLPLIGPAPDERGIPRDSSHGALMAGTPGSRRDIGN